MTDRCSFNTPPVATPEMIQAALDLVWEDSENHDELVRNIWQAMAAVAPSAEPSPRAQALEEGDLNARLKAKGMYSIDEMMGTLPVDKWRVQSGMTDLKFFGEWLERKTREYLTMKAAYDAGDKDESDELYEWVLAHYGAFHDVLVNFRAALSSQPVADAALSAKSQHINSGAFRRLSKAEWIELGADSNPKCDWHEGIGYVIYDDQAHQEYLRKTNALPASPGASE